MDNKEEKKIKNEQELKEILNKLINEDEARAKLIGKANQRYKSAEEYRNSAEYAEQRKKLEKEFLDKVKYE